eukprot:scaffold10551_cov264-Chaetoceros_neogracile.AAC.3
MERSDPSYSKTLALISLVASASAFAPTQFGARTSTQVFIDFGKYDDQLWSNDAKKDVYATWDPASPRSTMNFNPFETFLGNSPDASGIFPGEPFYKDPQRPDVSYAIMLAEKAEFAERAAAPKAGDTPGAPGCKNGIPKN